MASTSETGHAKNVANFQDLIEFVTGYGATYNPSKSSLKLAQLVALKATAEAKRMEFLFELYEKYTADLFTKVKPTKKKK